MEHSVAIHIPLDFVGARDYALRRLAEELSPKLYYHSLWHTQSEVLPSAELLAELSGIEGEDLVLLRTAALYHDIGFVHQRVEHEQAGAAIAAEVLPNFGYSVLQVKRVCGMIMATRLPQSPTNLLEQLLADSDLDSLGRDDFMPRNHALREEWAAFGTFFTDEQWYSSQLRFLESHHYWSEAALKLRTDGKEYNKLTLRALLAAYQQEE
jgi:uncharacterized protein